MRHFAHSYVNSLALILKIKKDPLQRLSVYKNGAPFYFRGCDEHALIEVFSNDEYGFLRGYLQSLSEPRVIDVGAHIGTFALWCFEVCPQASVLSVEPSRDTWQVLVDNMSSYANSWRCLNKAAYDMDGKLLKLKTSAPSMSHRLDDKGDIEVVSISLERLVNEVVQVDRPVDLLKVDIEGAEDMFLLGKSEILKRVNRVVVELHPYLCDTIKIEKELKALFSVVIDMNKSRSSNKPLLLCHN